MSRKGSSHKGNSQNDSNEKHSAAIREFQSAFIENKKCFECDQRGPTYVDMTIGSFVCTKCSGMLRGITPPHRIKSISMSSFSAEEVTFLKSRGNIWCSKVWMGLYDKSRSVAPDSKDEDGLKYHIIQKYEKKSYYVDPSQIQQTLNSITSSNTLSLAAASESVTSSGSIGGFIGTTLSHRGQNSSAVGQSAVMASHANSNITSSSRPVTGGTSTGKTSQISSSKANGNIGSSNSGIITGIVFPPPVIDPFSSSNSNFPPINVRKAASNSTPSSVSVPAFSSALGEAFSTVSQPQNSSSGLVGSNLAGISNIVSAPPNTTLPSSSGTQNANESFANFDAVKFDSVSDPWSQGQTSQSTPKMGSNPNPQFAPLTPGNAKTNQVPPSVTSMNSETPSGGAFASVKSQEDRYSALKELDEIFKSTVVMSDGKSTGTSLFGTSPLASQPSTGLDPSPIMNPATSVFGPSPTNSNAHQNNGFDTSFPATWNNPEVKTTPGPQQPQNPENRGFSPSWVPNWGNTSGTTPSATSNSNGSGNQAPINPFTGASNLTQLNTSPWPTTGTSPVQNKSAWPNMSANSTNVPPASTNTGLVNFGQNSNQTDPFGAAPAANLQKTENNNDLFAKAPKPFGSEAVDNSTINALTQDFFRNAQASPTVNNSGAQPGAFNPWATPPAAAAPAASMTSPFFASSASKNPFL